MAVGEAVANGSIVASIATVAVGDGPAFAVSAKAVEIEPTNTTQATIANLMESAGVSEVYSC